MDDSRHARFVRQIDWIGRGTWLKTDTHVHTVFSDGDHSVSEVAARAKKFGCHVLAITDHGNPDLRAATAEYAEAIEVARRQYPGMTILAGMEWNIPPWDGDAHATVLLPSDGGREWMHLAEFKKQFDDYDRLAHEEQLCFEALRWLDGVRSPAGSLPVVIYNHPSRRLLKSIESVAHIKRWRQINDLVVGFSGAPGHQAREPLGEYSYGDPTVDRWDAAAANVGGAWDVLLQSGLDVWAARAASDFHSEPATGGSDYWPGQFSETWLYAPEHSADGALQAFRAGSFFAAHGHIVREARLAADVPGLSRPAEAGETIAAPQSSVVTVTLNCRIPERDWNAQPNRIDRIELVAVTANDAAVVASRAPQPQGIAFVEQLRVPPGGLIVRARGRRIVEDGPDLLFYTNPIRIQEKPARPTGWHLAELRASLSSLRWWAGMAILAVVALLLVSHARRRGGEPKPASPHGGLLDRSSAPSPGRGHFLALACLYGVFVTYGSLVPFHVETLTLPAAAEEFWESFVSVPVRVGRIDFSVNVLLMVPLAFALSGALLVDSTTRVRQFAATGVVFTVCMAWSLAIEFSQLWVVSRISSRYDNLAHLLGTLLGMGLWLLCGPAAVRWLRSRRAASEPADRVAWLLQLYLAVVAVISLLPLDLTIHPSDLYEKYRTGRICLVPFVDLQWDRESLLAHIFHAALFVPVGMLLARLMRRSDRPTGSLLQAVLVGGLLVAAIEICQLVVYSRFTSTTDVVTGVLGVSLGGLLSLYGRSLSVERPIPARRARMVAAATWLALAAVYCVVPCLFLWAPFEATDDAEIISAQLGKFLNVPFSRMYNVSYLNSLTQLVHKTFLFVPLGGLLAASVYALGERRLVRRCLLAAALVASAGLALLIEFVQALLPDRTPDVTDVLLYVSGGMAGMLVAGWLYGPRLTAGHLLDAERSSSPQPGDTHRASGLTAMTGESGADRHGSPAVVPTTRPYIPGLDGLRAVACLAVFGVHWRQYTGVGGHAGAFDFGRLLENGNTGVALFLVLSGFLLSVPLWRSSPPLRAPAALDGFAARRFARIVPAYVVCLSAVVIATAHWGSAGQVVDTGLHYLFLHNLTDRTFYSISAPFWAMAVFAQCYAAFAAVVWLAGRFKCRSDRSWLALFGGLSVASYAVHVLTVTIAGQIDPWPLPTDVLRPDGPAVTRSLIAHLPLFFLGAVGGYIWEVSRQRPNRVVPTASRPWELTFWLSALAVVLILATELDTRIGLPYGRYHFPVVPALLTGMIVAVPQTRLAVRVLEFAPVRLLGAISYGFYIYHLPSLAVLGRLFRALQLDPRQMPYLFGACGLIVAVAVSLVSYFCLEQWILRRARQTSRFHVEDRAPNPTSLAVWPPH